jgi:hypothetical protein
VASLKRRGYVIKEASVRLPSGIASVQRSALQT